MEKKGKGVAWPESDSDFSDLSIHSSELSDLDSDVHSLSSLMSCANSWIEDAKYPTPAESTLKCLTFAAGVGEPQGTGQDHHPWMPRARMHVLLHGRPTRCMPPPLP